MKKLFRRLFLRVYRLNEFEWWTHYSMERAIRLAMNETGCCREDVFDPLYASRLTSKELDTLTVELDTFDLWPGDSAVVTFRESLNLNIESGKGPGLFGATEC